MNENIREQFPALRQTFNGRKMIFLDGPAGTQVPERVIHSIREYYTGSNANTHGYFETSRRTDDVIDEAREKCAALIGAESASCISFGANMTSLAFKLSRAFSRIFEPGDEIVITQLDHEANRGPWIILEENGIIVREIDLLPDGRLDYEDASRKITHKTKLVAAGWASNILGTVNDLAALRRLSSDAGAWLLVDAVHYAPHYRMNVQSVRCDFLLCSAYKFYGPHIGILYCKPGLLNQLPTDRLRTGPQAAPGRIETGTFNHASLAATSASIDFIASLGVGNTYGSRLDSAFARISLHERNLVHQLYDGLSNIKGVAIHGTPIETGQRSPTLAITIEGAHPDDICKYLGDRNIASWHGHFYAVRATEILDLENAGGVVRLGISLYNTVAEIAATITTIEEFVKSIK